MGDRRETVLTTSFVAACLVLATIGLAPHLHARRAAPVPTMPDLDVAVSGEVHEPGRYRLPWDAVVADLVELAGGLTGEAARELVDPVAPLGHGTTIHVPARAAADGDPRISVNAATASELERLPGIGPALAARIVAARPFHAIDELERVSGIGPVTLERLRDMVRL